MARLPRLRCIPILWALTLGPALAAPEPAPIDPRPLLAAAGAEDAAALDRLADSGPPALRGEAAVARIHTLDDAPARRAALDAGFVVRWQALGPLPGGPRLLDRVTPPISDWVEAKADGTYRGVRGPASWRVIGASTRYGLLDLAALSADVPGILLARAAVRLTDGGGLVAWVYSAGPWRLWVDGEPAGGGWGESSLRTAQPVMLSLNPGAHRLLVVTTGEGAAVAVRFAEVDGRPRPVEPMEGRSGPHGMSLGPLPGKAAAIGYGTIGYGAIELPPLFAPRAGIAEATPAERRALVEAAPERADLWRRVARESDGDAAEAAWARVAALDPLDLEARRRVQPTAWPAPPRDPEGARAPPPEGFAGPLWWARVDDRVEVAGGALIAQRTAAIRVMDPAAEVPWPPADADVRACTALRGEWVMPLPCPLPGDVDRPAVQAGDVLVLTWRRGRRDGVARMTPPPAPFGVWRARVEADDGAALRISPPEGTRVERTADRRIWTLETSSGSAPFVVGTVLDDGALAEALDTRLPVHAPWKVPAPDGDAVLDALRESTVLGPVAPDVAADALMAALAIGGHVGWPVFARPVDTPGEAIPDPAAWPIALVALGDDVLDPRHPDGARPAALQGAPAVRVEPDGTLRRFTLPVDPPSRHRLTVRGELRVEDGALLAVELDRWGRSPLADVDGLLRGHPGAEVLDRAPGRLTVRLPAAKPVFALGDPEAGPHAVSIELIIRAPAGARLPADVELERPAGRYVRKATPTADGVRLVRRFEWRGLPMDAQAEAFLAAVRAREAEPLVAPAAEEDP